MPVAVSSAVLGYSPQAQSPRRTVQIDVAVRDNGLSHVSGLEVQDFSVRLDGRAAGVLTTREIAIPIGRRGTGQAVVESASEDVFLGASLQPDERVVAVALDTWTLPRDAQQVRRAQRLMEELATALSDGDRMAVLANIHVPSPNQSAFVRDPIEQQLIVERATTWLRTSRSLEDGTDSRQSAHRHLRSILYSMSGARSGSRTLIVMTAGLARIESDESGRRSYRDSSERDLAETIRAARRVGVVIHLVDPVLRELDYPTDDDLRFQHDYLSRLAEATGGRLWVPQAALAGVATALARLESHYYRLEVVVPAGIDFPATFDVNTSRGFASVRTGGGVAVSSGGIGESPADAAARAAALSGLPRGRVDLLATAALLGPSGDRRGRAYVRLRTGGDMTETVGGLIFRAAAFDEEGLLIEMLDPTTVTEAPDRDPDGDGRDVEFLLDLPYEASRLGLGVASPNGVLAGAVQVPILRLDRSAPLVLSSLLLGERSAREGVSFGLPVVPTLKRRFPTSAPPLEVVALASWPSAGEDRVSVRFTIRGERGDIVARPKFVTGETGQDGRTRHATLMFPVVVSALPPGRYQVQIEAWGVGFAHVVRALTIVVEPSR